jgi:hypothetical protein
MAAISVARRNTEISAAAAYQRRIGGSACGEMAAHYQWQQYQLANSIISVSAYGENCRSMAVSNEWLHIMAAGVALSKRCAHLLSGSEKQRRRHHESLNSGYAGAASSAARQLPKSSWHHLMQAPAACWRRKPAISIKYQRVMARKRHKAAKALNWQPRRCSWQSNSGWRWRWQSISKQGAAKIRESGVLKASRWHRLILAKTSALALSRGWLSLALTQRGDDKTMITKIMAWRKKGVSAAAGRIGIK